MFKKTARSSLTLTILCIQLAADVTLQEEMSRNWQEIMSREYVFDRAEKHAAILSELG